MTTGLKEFKAADTSAAKLFTESCKPVCRNWLGYLGELERAVEEEEDAKMLEELEDLQKRGLAARTFSCVQACVCIRASIYT